MRIKEGQYPDSSGMAVKVDGHYVDVVQGYSKVGGRWVPWDSSTDIDLNIAVKVKTLDGLTLNLNKRKTA